MKCCICGRSTADVESISYPMTDSIVKYVLGKEHITFDICSDCENEVDRRTKTILKKTYYSFHEFVTELLIYKKSFEGKIVSKLLKPLDQIKSELNHVESSSYIEFESEEINSICVSMMCNFGKPILVYDKMKNGNYTAVGGMKFIYNHRFFVEENAPSEECHNKKVIKKLKTIYDIKKEYHHTIYRDLITFSNKNLIYISPNMIDLFGNPIVVIDKIDYYSPASKIMSNLRFSKEFFED